MNDKLYILDVLPMLVFDGCITGEQAINIAKEILGV